MAIEFLIARDGQQEYVVRLVGYADLLATIQQPRIHSLSFGKFPNEQHCIAYLHHTVGISMDRMNAALSELYIAGIEIPLPLSIPEGRRIIEQGFPL